MATESPLIPKRKYKVATINSDINAIEPEFFACNDYIFTLLDTHLIIGGIDKDTKIVVKNGGRQDFIYKFNITDRGLEAVRFYPTKRKRKR